MPVRPTSDHYAAIDAQQLAAAEALARRDPATLSDFERATLAGYYRAGVIGAAVAEPTSGIAGIVSKLPAAARLAAAIPGARVLNPKLWQEDTKRFRAVRKFPSAVWRSAARQVAKGRTKGDVLEPLIWGVCDVLERAARDTGGKVEMTFGRMASLVGCCIETARKVIRFLEDKGLVDTFNVLTRTGGKVLRDANLYLLRAPEGADAADQKPEPSEAPVQPLGALARLTARLERWAPAFGLVSRAWGLNATPLALNRSPPEPRTTPA